MNCRNLLGVAIGGASLAFAADKVFAGEHAGHVGHPALSEAARQCVSAGDACLSHCLALFVKGDMSVAPCANSVYQMSAVCEAVARLASAELEHLAGLAKIAHAACLDCEKECRKHENEHATCKACAEACAACAEECKKHMA